MASRFFVALRSIWLSKKDLLFMNSKAFLIIGIVLVISSCSPQKKAAKNFRYGKYQKVINHYRGVLAKQPNNGKANYFVAESYRLSNRLKEAEPYYAKAGGSGISRDSVLIYYSESLKANGKYDEARKTLEELEANAETDGIKNRARKELDGLNYLQKLAGRKSYYKIKNLESINTPLSEYDPVYVYNPIAIPTLHLTGTEDHTPIPGLVTNASDRRVPFDSIVATPRYLGIFEKGRHTMFNDWSRDDASQRIKASTRALTLAFWQASLLGDATALQRLAEPVSTTSPLAAWERR